MADMSQWQQKMQQQQEQEAQNQQVLNPVNPYAPAPTTPAPITYTQTINQNNPTTLVTAIQQSNAANTAAAAQQNAGGAALSPGASYAGAPTILGGTWGNTPATLAAQVAAGNQIAYQIQEPNGTVRTATPAEASQLTQQAVNSLNSQQQQQYNAMLQQIQNAVGATPQQQLVAVQAQAAAAIQAGASLGVPVNQQVANQIAANLGTKPIIVPAGANGEQILALLQSQAIQAAQSEYGITPSVFAKGSATTTIPQEPGAEYIQYGKGKIVPKAAFDEMSDASQAKIMKTANSDNLILLADGQFAKKSEFDKISIDQQQILLKQGYSAYQTAKAQTAIITKTIDGKDYVQIVDKDNQGNSQFMLKTSFDQLDPKFQTMLVTQGYKAYQNELSTNYVKLSDNTYILKTQYDQIGKDYGQRFQTILTTAGMDAFNKALATEYAQITNTDGSETWVSRAEIAQLPVIQQTVLEKDGFDGLAKFVAENQQKLSGFTYIDDKGQANIDILTAMRSGADQAIKNLFTQKQIDDVVAGKPINPTIDISGNIGDTAKSVGQYVIQELQIAGESLASPAVVQGMAKAYVQVLDLAKNSLISGLSPLQGLSDNDLNKAIASNKDIQNLNKAIDTNVKDGLTGWSEFTDTFALPTLSGVEKNIHDWMQQAPDWQKPERAVLGAVADMIPIIPLMVAGTLTGAFAKGGLGQEQKSAEQITGLLAGAGSWFLTRPSAIVSNPLVEGPYTVAMLMGPEKLKAIAEDTMVKILPFPQKGTSIEAMGINPSDIARVSTPNAVSPVEALQILQTMEKNLAKTYGDNIGTEILGKTRDQINVTTDDGLGTGRTLVSGLQRAVPLLLQHASGGEFHDALVNDINTKGYFEVESQNMGRGSVEFLSPQLSGSFLKNNPAIINGLWSS